MGSTGNDFLLNNYYSDSPLTVLTVPSVQSDREALSSVSVDTLIHEDTAHTHTE